jgi:hypothetical protein
MPPSFDKEYYGVAGFNAAVLGKPTSVCTLPADSQIRQWWMAGYRIAKKRAATQCMMTGGRRAAA